MKISLPSLTALLSTAHLALRHDVGEHLGQLRQRVARPRHGSRLHHPHLHRGIRIESLCLVTEMSLLFVCRLVSYLHIRHQTASGAVRCWCWFESEQSLPELQVVISSVTSNFHSQPQLGASWSCHYDPLWNTADTFQLWSQYFIWNKSIQDHCRSWQEN